MKKRRIGIDFHVVDGKFQGSRTHVIELFSRVITTCQDCEFFLFADDTEGLRILSTEFCHENVHLIRMPIANPLKRLLWQLPVFAKLLRLDILHTQYILPPLLPCHGVVTIHDILFETHPEYFTNFFRHRSRLMVHWSARQAAHIFTVSEFSRAMLKKYYKVKDDKIAVICNGVDTIRFHPPNPAEQPEEKNFLTEKGLRLGQYILSVGRLEPRKNYVNLIRAYAQLEDKDIPLVIVGQRDFRYREILELINILQLGNRVKIMEDIDDNKLPILYRHALFFAYPAHAEGFGMPPLEAMASGVPVITSETTSLPEVAGNAAILVDPNNSMQILGAMTKLTTLPSLRMQLSNLGLRRSQLFNWSTAAESVCKIYTALC